MYFSLASVGILRNANPVLVQSLLKKYVESASLTAKGKLFQSLTTGGRKELGYWVVREYIV